ncbi:MAG: AIPR family protein, partial [Clostridiaceae bacterium]|nr:AIPR family protein [Clostridiaceae bacterium]
NNGIAATAYSIETTDQNGVLYIQKITALQIVNGGQTTASLAMALIKDKRDGAEEKLNSIFVPMKLSVVSPEKAQELIPNISRYANSQNKVSEADLWSNHPFHIRMEGISRRIVAPAVAGNQFGTHWYYERANGQYKQETYKATEATRKRFELQNPKTQMFTKTDLAKYMNILRELPHVASAGGQKSFAKFAEWASTQWEKNEAIFNEGYFRRMVSMAIIFKQADKIVKTQAWYNSYKANIVAYTISKIVYTVRTAYPEYAIDYRGIWARQGLSSAWVRQIEVISKSVYEFLIDESRPVENVTEWAKRESCWDQGKKLKLTLLPEFVSELTYKSQEQEQARDDRTVQKQVNKVNAMIQVADYGVENWKFLLSWNNTHPLLSPTDISFVNSAIAMERGKFPSEKHCAVILQILEKARMEGFPK